MGKTRLTLWRNSRPLNRSERKGGQSALMWGLAAQFERGFHEADCAMAGQAKVKVVLAGILKTPSLAFAMVNALVDGYPTDDKMQISKGIIRDDGKKIQQTHAAGIPYWNYAGVFSAPRLG